MNYAQKVASTLVLAGAAVYTLFSGGCASSEHRTAGKEERAYKHSGKMEKVECIENVLLAYNKDGVINPAPNDESQDEILGTFKQKERIAKLRPALAESPELTARLAKAEETAESYLAKVANSDQVKGYLILITQRKNPGASVRVYGLNENDHLALEGTLATHVTALGLDRDEQLKKSPSAAGQKFGYHSDADLSEKIGEIRAATTHVDKTKWEAVADLIPASGLKTQSGDSISKAEYELMLKDGEVVDVRVIHLANAKPAEKKEEPKPADK